MLFSLSGDIAAFFRGRGGDFYRIRPYEPFESARHVDWRATAHTGELQVREFAREEEQTILLLLDLEQDEGKTFEASVDASAYLVWNFAQRGARVRFSTQQIQLRLPEDGDVYTILKYLALVSPVPGKTPPPPDDQHAFQVVISTRGGAAWPTRVGPRRAVVMLLLSILLGSFPSAGAAESPDSPRPNAKPRSPDLEPVHTSITVIRACHDGSAGFGYRAGPARDCGDTRREHRRSAAAGSGFTLFRRSSSLVANPTTQGVSLRGTGSSGASRTLVLWDGIPLNDPFGGWVYWDRVPPG